MSALLSVKDLSIDVKINKKLYTAVDSISFSLEEGEILGLAGESGCGKSLTAMSIPRLLADNIALRGSILFRDTEITALSEKELQKIRGNSISVIYQEPMSALNPLMKIGAQIEEAYRIHHDGDKKEAYKKTIEAMERVGLPNPESLYHEYPHNLSGGMKQRVVIAMAFINRPALLIADEPTTALDVTIQSQILELIKELTVETGSACIFISHDLGVLRQVCDRLSIMYCGQIVESGDVSGVLSEPLHYYTKGLLNSLPDASKAGKRLEAIEGRVEPLVKRKYGGCLFAGRCQARTDACELNRQPVFDIGGRKVRCTVANEIRRVKVN